MIIRHDWVYRVWLTPASIDQPAVAAVNQTIVQMVHLYSKPSAALKSRDLTSRDWTRRHQIKHTATGWTSVGPIKNWTCWTISERIKSCLSRFYSGAIVACSFCVQTAILSAGRQQQQQQQQRGRRREQAGACASSANFRNVGIGNGSHSNNLGRLLRSAHRGATCWLRTGAVRT